MTTIDDAQTHAKAPAPSSLPKRWQLFSGLLLMALFTLPAAAAASDESDVVTLTDFTPDTGDMGWFVVNDNVMGGRSEGTFALTSRDLLFTGRTNTRGGGFSSIRTRGMQLDLSGFNGIQLGVKGDGRRYTWRLTSTARWRGGPVSYWAEFETKEGSWIEVNIPFASFVPKIRGFDVEAPALDSSMITGMGLMIYDGNDGDFRLQLDSVNAYR